MSKQVQTPEDFNVNNISIVSERFNAPITISNICVELNIYENINLPYLTGNLIIMDDNGLFSLADFKGTERVQIDVSSAFNSDAHIFKTFVINRIERTINHNDHTKLISVSLVEEVLFYNNIQSISKTYNGTGEKIIETVLNDKLNKKLYKNNSFRKSFQQAFRIIAPYITPFDIIQMCLDKMTTENGSPYFLYSSLYTDDLILADLDTINETQPFNKQPFTYSQSAANNNSSNSLIEQSRSIYSVEAVNQEDTLMLAETGSIGSIYSTTNVSTGEVTTTQFDINNLYDRLLGAGVLPSSLNNRLIDNDFVPDGSGVDTRKLSDFTSKRFHQVAGGQTYPFSQEINNWTYENDAYTYSLRLNSYVMKQLLYKNNFNIMLPGFQFLLNDYITSVGSNINLLIYKSEIPSNPTSLKRDNKKSGKFIITSKRHIFNIADFKHTVSLTCSRISNERLEV